MNNSRSNQEQTPTKIPMLNSFLVERTASGNHWQKVSGIPGKLSPAVGNPQYKGRDKPVNIQKTSVIPEISSLSNSLSSKASKIFDIYSKDNASNSVYGHISRLPVVDQVLCVPKNVSGVSAVPNPEPKVLSKKAKTQIKKSIVTAEIKTTLENEQFGAHKSNDEEDSVSELIKLMKANINISADNLKISKSIAKTVSVFSNSEIKTKIPFKFPLEELPDIQSLESWVNQGDDNYSLYVSI